MPVFVEGTALTRVVADRTVLSAKALSFEELIRATGPSQDPVMVRDPAHGQND
jgi:hypothetical protein